MNTVIVCRDRNDCLNSFNRAVRNFEVDNEIEVLCTKPAFFIKLWDDRTYLFIPKTNIEMSLRGKAFDNLVVSQGIGLSPDSQRFLQASCLQRDRLAVVIDKSAEEYLDELFGITTSN